MGGMAPKMAITLGCLSTGSLLLYFLAKEYLLAKNLHNQLRSLQTISVNQLKDIMLRRQQQ